MRMLERDSKKLFAFGFVAAGMLILITYEPALRVLNENEPSFAVVCRSVTRVPGFLRMPTSTPPMPSPASNELLTNKVQSATTIDFFIPFARNHTVAVIPVRNMGK